MTLRHCLATLVLVAGATLTLLRPAAADAQTTQPAPPQDQGLPYTRSARTTALKQIGNATAVFVGSRYAYAGGFKVRLDDVNWRDEAFERDGSVFVPVAFASVLADASPAPSPAPDYLADRWVYTTMRSAVELPSSVRVAEMEGRRFVSVEDVAAHLRLAVSRDGGLLLISRSTQSITPPLPAGVAREAVITLFDTPEKFADPDIATKHVPTLAAQGKWTDHVKVSPQQHELLNGDETRWELTPTSAYDYAGFDAKLLGSPVPPPGVYPRVLFSEADIPAIADRIRASALGRKSWAERKYLLDQTFLDPKTSDGKLFGLLASGDVDAAAAALAAHKPGIFSTHVDYLPEVLANLALQCLLERDDVRGRQVAKAIATCYRLRESRVDEWNSVSDSEWGSQYIDRNGKVVYPTGNGSTTHWRGMHGVVGHMNLGLALDFGGKWMDAADKQFMQRLIAKATYGRRAHGQDGPVRFADVNWVTWDLPQYLALLAIEGLPECDMEALKSNERTIRAFCQYGIDENGVVYESNGKSPGGFQHLLLAMVAKARRGENDFGHPHFRKLLQGQVQMTSPNGKVIVNSGTQYNLQSRDHLSTQLTLELKAFYPQERLADYLLGNRVADGPDSKDVNGGRMFAVEQASEADYFRDIAATKRLRMPSPMYPGFVRGFLYDTDYVPTTRADLGLPLEFSAPVHGVFSAYSDRTPEATWACMMVRPNHYMGAGHHHADAGMFFFSALGVDWITESPFSQAYAGKYHNQVLVDGRSQSDNLSGLGTSYQGAGQYLGATVRAGGAFASADLTYSYSWTWQTQPSQEWPAENPGWEFDPSPEVARIFAGTARYKLRPWWMTSNYSNYIATSRAPFNPMQYVYRSIGLVRGEHPYAIVTDDLKKDEQTHLYQWTAMLSAGVWQADFPGLKSNQLVLGFRPAGAPSDPKSPEPQQLIKPTTGEPLVLVQALSPAESGDESMPMIQVLRNAGVTDRKGVQLYYDRLVINHRGGGASYRVLLVPFRAGESVPAVLPDTTADHFDLRQGDQVDRIRFDAASDGRTTVAVERDGKPVAGTQ